MILLQSIETNYKLSDDIFATPFLSDKLIFCYVYYVNCILYVHILSQHCNLSVYFIQHFFIFVINKLLLTYSSGTSNSLTGNLFAFSPTVNRNKLDRFKLQRPIWSGVLVGFGLLLQYDLGRLNFADLSENVGNEKSIGMLK